MGIFATLYQGVVEELVEVGCMQNVLLMEGDCICFRRLLSACLNRLLLLLCHLMTGIMWRNTVWHNGGSVGDPNVAALTTRFPPNLQMGHEH